MTNPLNGPGADPPDLNLDPVLGTVTRALQDQRRGSNSQAEEVLDAFYRKRVLGLARKILQSRRSDRRATVTAPSDVAQQVIARILRVIEEGRYDNLNSRDQLWSLFAQATRHAVNDTLKIEFAKKRGGGQIRGESGIPSIFDSQGAPWDQVADENATNACALSLVERVEYLMEQLTPHEQEVIKMVAEHGTAGAAKLLDLSPSTIRLRTKAIRGRLLPLL